MIKKLITLWVLAFAGEASSPRWFRRRLQPLPLPVEESAKRTSQRPSGVGTKSNLSLEHRYATRKSRCVPRPLAVTHRLPHGVSERGAPSPRSHWLWTSLAGWSIAATRGELCCLLCCSYCVKNGFAKHFG